MAQLTIYELASLPPASLVGLEEGSDYLHIKTADYLRVRLRASGDAGVYGAVRPYYKFENAWVPLRGDAVDAVGVQPVRAQTDKLNGWADGCFHSGGLSTPVILVLEDSNAIGVAHVAGYLDVADTEG